MNLIQGGMTLTKYVAKFIQLSRFVIYLIPDVEKKVKKFQRDLKPHTRTMMACFDIRVFFQRMDRASIYEESFQENTTAAAEQRKRTFAPSPQNILQRAWTWKKNGCEQSTISMVTSRTHSSLPSVLASVASEELGTRPMSAMQQGPLRVLQSQHNDVLLMWPVWSLQ